MKVLMIIAPNNFRDEELLEPKALLEADGFRVLIASKGVSSATGMLGAKARVDLDLSSVKPSDYDAVLFVGGVGAKVYFNDPIALSIAKEAIKSCRAVGAICIAPSVLANAGLLKGKKATASISEKSNLELKGAVYTGEGVTVDGKIVTASEPSAAKDFGRAIIKLLKKTN